MLPHWPAGTVAILATSDGTPHAIPVSAVLRGSDRHLLLALAARRGSLGRLREQPQVAVALIAPDLAVTAEGTARVIADPLTEGTVGIEVAVSTVHDHDRPAFAIESGVQWHWTDDEAAARDAGVRAALERLTPKAS